MREERKKKVLKLKSRLKTEAGEEGLAHAKIRYEGWLSLSRSLSLSRFYRGAARGARNESRRGKKKEKPEL